MLPGPAAAIQVQVEGELPTEVEEKQVISSVLTISSIPSAADFIYFDTDLIKSEDQPVYNFTGLGLQSNESHYVLPVEGGQGKIVVLLNGQVPEISEVKQCDKLTLVKYNPKLTGYAHYRIRLTDEDGNPIKESDTRTFSIVVPEIEAFEQKMTLVDDSFFNAYLQDMFDKGLVTEANEIADYLIKKEENSFNWSYLIIGLAIAAVSFILGVRTGGSEEEEEEE
ncbi:hypothetical protein [Methanosarcina sp. KYL-1]|uniref:hypothetical protein n=1 Tax=Methanosarcina sp. KYL-1 TaxID=2602068 RepID=UPI00210117A1|nr:hypothetical protein [Methanosarcina sp. KYL-1]